MGKVTSDNVSKRGDNDFLANGKSFICEVQALG